MAAVAGGSGLGVLNEIGRVDWDGEGDDQPVYGLMDMDPRDLVNGSTGRGHGYGGLGANCGYGRSGDGDILERTGRCSSSE